MFSSEFLNAMGEWWFRRDAANRRMESPMNRSHTVSRRSISMAAAIALAAITMFAPASHAQTPETDGGHAHPVHIHAGTCAELGEVVVPLNDIVTAEGEFSGPESAVAVTMSQTIVDMPLRDIIDGGHAINVHLSSDEIGTYIACGDIGGVVVPDDEGGEELMIGLSELNDSGYVGVAWLGASADGTKTEVSVVIVEPEM